MLRSFAGAEPEVAPSARVDETSVVIGDVTIEAEASVWPGAVLRGDAGSIVLREGANVQDNATLHEGAEIGRFATVGHNTVVHGARTGPRSMVGMGAVVLDGASIGEGSLVGAGSVVTEGTEVPDGVLAAGSPAAVRKEVEDSPWTEAGERYVELATAHAETSEVLDE